MISYLEILNRIMFKKFPLQLTFFVTSRCNFKCEMCFYHKNLNVPKRELSLNEISNISENMDNLLWLLLSGGEPFLRKDLHQICQIFSENNKVRNISIPTNGFYTKEIVKTTKKILDNCDSFLNITLSFNNIFDNYEKICGLKGSFQKLLNTLERVQSLKREYNKLSINANIVFSSFTQDNIEENYDFIRNSGVDNISISLVRGNTKNQVAKNIDIAKYEEMIKRLSNNSQFGYNFPLSNLFLQVKNNFLRNYVIKTYKKKKRIIPCYAGTLNSVIDEIGNVYPCEPLNISLGNLREVNYDFKKLWLSKKAAHIRKLINKKICYCTHECYMMTNILFNPKMIPKLLLKVLKSQ